MIHLFADFMRYLFTCAEKFICETHPTVARSWSDLKKTGSITFVIAHPNGWEGAQQAKLRRSAVMGGLVPDTPDGRSRVSFVTEGEASLHFCIRGGFIDDVRPFINFFYFGVLLTFGVPPSSKKGLSLLILEEVRSTSARTE